MNSYEVTIFETVSHSTTVEAENEDEAYDKAYTIICNGPDKSYSTEPEGFTGMYYINKL